MYLKNNLLGGVCGQSKFYMRRRKCEKKCKTIFNQNKHRHLVGRDVRCVWKKIDSTTQLKYLYSENGKTERRELRHTYVFLLLRIYGLILFTCGYFTAVYYPYYCIHKWITFVKQSCSHTCNRIYKKKPTKSQPLLSAAAAHDTHNFLLKDKSLSLYIYISYTPFSLFFFPLRMLMISRAVRWECSRGAMFPITQNASDWMVKNF